MGTGQRNDIGLQLASAANVRSLTSGIRCMCQGFVTYNKDSNIYSRYYIKTLKCPIVSMFSL